MILSAGLGTTPTHRTRFLLAVSLEVLGHEVTYAFGSVAPVRKHLGVVGGVRLLDAPAVLEHALNHQEPGRAMRLRAVGKDRPIGAIRERLQEQVDLWCRDIIRIRRAEGYVDVLQSSGSNRI